MQGRCPPRGLGAVCAAAHAALVRQVPRLGWPRANDRRVCGPSVCQRGWEGGDRRDQSSRVL